MLVDASILLSAVDRTNPHHEAAASWLTDRLNGDRRVGFAWDTIGAFLRIATSPRIYEDPLSPDTAWQRVEDWLSADVAWTPVPGPGYAGVCRALWASARPTGKLVPDALLAALAIEHGLELVSADTDFGRFDGLRWHNPLR